MVESELVCLPGKALAWDVTRRLRFVVYVAGWLHSVVLHGRGHIGRSGKMSVSGYRGWLKSSPIPICCVREQDTLCALLHLTQLTNEYQTGTSS